MESFESQEEDFEIDMLFDGEPVESEENWSDVFMRQGVRRRAAEFWTIWSPWREREVMPVRRELQYSRRGDMKAWIRDSAAGGDRQCLILAMRWRWT